MPCNCCSSFRFLSLVMPWVQRQNAETMIPLLDRSPPTWEVCGPVCISVNTDGRDETAPLTGDSRTECCRGLLGHGRQAREGVGRFYGTNMEGVINEWGNE